MKNMFLIILGSSSSAFAIGCGENLHGYTVSVEYHTLTGESYPVHVVCAGVTVDVYNPRRLNNCILADGYRMARKMAQEMCLAQSDYCDAGVEEHKEGCFKHNASATGVWVLSQTQSN